jgi:tetratricopeptide (TPR) repeat protein/predicted Ser/Thr protein kinase
MNDGFALRELDDLFQQALALPEADRGAFLDRECQSRPILYGKLQRMLDADAKACGFLDHPLAADLTVQPRARIGRWKLIEPIGEGGLGVVYRASCEADGVTLHAAVKILRAGFDRGVFHERFIQERNILSGLDHPYIARLIDAGADTCGDSFLAIEFVNGQPLDQYLEESHSSLRERLDLFIKLCEAVGYLHSNGIIHGDIKPSNVMVKQEATPKLLDFGTARLIDPENLGASKFSRLIMTPGYASPEQRAGLGPSALGDVYSLGCVLRDILAHATPQSDVCTIRDRCLSPSPSDRYQSPGEIAADVQRYLHYFPVRARPASGWYVTLKFLRRNRIGCGLAALAIVSLLVGWLLSRHDARRADHYAGQHKSVVAHLLKDQPAAESPESNQRAALAAGIRDVIAQMEGMNSPPLAELANAWRRLGYTQATRGQTPQSVESIGRSIEYARRYRAGGDTAVARASLGESLLYAAHLEVRRGYMRNAGEYAVEAIGLIDTLPAPARDAVVRKPQFLQALSAAAHQRARAGDVPGGRDFLVRGLEQSRSLSKSLQLRMLLDLASLERRAGNAGQAETYCREANSLELVNPRLRTVCYQGAESIDIDKRASMLLQEVSALEKRLVRDPERFGDRQQLARLKLQLGWTIGQSGDTARARRLFEEARALAKALLDADPENLRLRFLSRNIDLAAARIEPGDSPGARPRIGGIWGKRRGSINRREAMIARAVPKP